MVKAPLPISTGPATTGVYEAIVPTERTMMPELDFLTGDILDSSAFLRLVRALAANRRKSRLFGNDVRSLTPGEIAMLAARGNRCADWETIHVADGFSPENISGTLFIGACVLGVFGHEPAAVDSSLSLLPGIYNSIIVDSEIGSGSLVHNTAVSRYIICEKAAVFSVGELSCTGSTNFGNGTTMPVGIETGGRDILSFADLTIPLARAIALGRGTGGLLSAYAAFVKKYADACFCERGIAGAGSRIRFAGRIRDSFVGPGCVVDGATLLDNCTVIGSTQEPCRVGAGSIVRNSCLQWGSTVDSAAIVENSVLLEYSTVERHAKVSRSIVGPNTHIAEGEVTASLVGPLVGFHHQAMLIGALWPDGKGNVAGGANVGSNHTSRAPDQELWCGEGMFFGLGVNVKYPADYSRAPYTVIATGVTTPPQRLAFPFSLVTSPSRNIEGVFPNLNELVPGWVLSDNVYALQRNEAKFRQRNRATRSVFPVDVLRPDTMDLVIEARNRLAAIDDQQPWYDAVRIPGAGKNYVTEPARVRGIETYTRYIEYYCLKGLLRRMEHHAAVATVYRKATADPVWEHQRAVMKREGLSLRGVKENLARLADLQEEISRDTLAAKQKDDQRGARIVGDYAKAHQPAERDPIVIETREYTKKLKASIQTIVSGM